MFIYLIPKALNRKAVYLCILNNQVWEHDIAGLLNNYGKFYINRVIIARYDPDIHFVYKILCISIAKPL